MNFFFIITSISLNQYDNGDFVDVNENDYVAVYDNDYVDVYDDDYVDTDDNVDTAWPRGGYHIQKNVYKNNRQLQSRLCLIRT